MYDGRHNTIIGFHGCDLSVRNKIISNPNQIEISKKPYDWLGNGFYIWENNSARAMQWAIDKAERGEIDRPAVLGAIIQLANCCDFLDSKFTSLIETYYPAMAEEYNQAGKPLPRNVESVEDEHGDKLVRLLDCATIEYLHKLSTEKYFKERGRLGYIRSQVFDSVRGVFSEGGPAFPGAGIKKKSHIQICIRNLNCIKGFFIPREKVEFPLPL